MRAQPCLVLSLLLPLSRTITLLSLAHDDGETNLNGTTTACKKIRQPWNMRPTTSDASKRRRTAAPAIGQRERLHPVLPRPRHRRQHQIWRYGDRSASRTASPLSSCLCSSSPTSYAHDHAPDAPNGRTFCRACVLYEGAYEQRAWPPSPTTSSLRLYDSASVSLRLISHFVRVFLFFLP